MNKKEKIEFIRNNLEKGYDYISRHTNLKINTIKKYKSKYLDIKERVRWSDKEIQFLKDNYFENGAMYCSEKLKRTIATIHNKANRLNIKHNSYIRHEKKECPKGYHYCWACKQELTESKFYRRKSGEDLKLNHICKSCYLKRHKRIYATRSNQKYADKYKDNPAKGILITVKNRAKRKGIKFNLTEDDIKIPKKCPVLDIELKPFSGSDNSPSVDRLDPNKGYIKDNIRIISMRANSIKRDASKDEIYKIYQYMEREGL